MIVGLQERIADMLEAGSSLDVIDERVIQPAPLSEDQKAALWLFAWSRLSHPRAHLVAPPQLAVL